MTMRRFPAIGVIKTLIETKSPNLMLKGIQIQLGMKKINHLGRSVKE